MRDTTLSPELRQRIQDWNMILTLRLYGQNIYSDESYILKVYDSETIEDVDLFFESVLADFKFKKRDIARLYKLLHKAEDILGR